MDWTKATVVIAHIAGADEGHKTTLGKVNGYVLGANWADWVTLPGSQLVHTEQLSDVEVALW